MTDRANYSTRNELEFIRNLGMYSAHSAPRDELLSKYLQAAYERTDWGEIDSAVVIAAAEKALVHECGRAKRTGRKKNAA